jgi:hypothetical protein
MKKRILPAGLLILTLALTFLLISCDSDRKFQVTTYHDQQTIDTLLVDLVSYIGVKPKSTDWQTRHEPQYRTHYIRHAEEFEFDRYYITKDSIHYFFLIRPARHAMGNRRGVGGRFRMNSDQSIYELVEYYNTPVMPVEDIREKGREVFYEMLETGSIDRYLGNKQYIEWPDDRLNYHKEKNEWRYDVE